MEQNMKKEKFTISLIDKNMKNREKQTKYLGSDREGLLANHTLRKKHTHTHTTTLNESNSDCNYTTNALCLHGLHVCFGLGFGLITDRRWTHGFALLLLLLQLLLQLGHRHGCTTMK
jgi:hypothetical protein